MCLVIQLPWGGGTPQVHKLRDYWAIAFFFSHALLSQKKSRPLRCSYPGPQYPWWQRQFGQKWPRAWRRQWPCWWAIEERRWHRLNRGINSTVEDQEASKNSMYFRHEGQLREPKQRFWCEWMWWLFRMEGAAWQRMVLARWWLTLRHDVWMRGGMEWSGGMCVNEEDVERKR